MWVEEELVDSLVQGSLGFRRFWCSLRVSGRPRRPRLGLDRRNNDHNVIDKDPYFLPVRYF